MKKGLFLQGGGAKGAFQAGVIYGLYEKGYEFDVIAGTSIGAINGYFAYNGDFEGLKRLWTKDIWNLKSEQISLDKSGLVLNNGHIIDMLSKVSENRVKGRTFFVNYVEIDDKKLYERQVDLSKMDKESGIDAIKYSALLPYKRSGNESFEDILRTFDSRIVFDKFKQDIKDGIYDGYKLDGGIMNNNFLDPFKSDKVQRLYLVPFYENYQIPEYITENYGQDQVVSMEPDFRFQPNDTLRFEKEFCEKLFDKGYKLTKER